MIRIIGISCVLFCLLACQEQHDFIATKSFEEGQWSSQNNVVASFDIQDTSKYYQIGLDLVHGTAFAYQNIYIQIETSYPASSTKKQTLSFDLADKEGTWFGKCINDKCQVRVILQEKAKFFEVGQHLFTIRPYMRVDPVSAIHSFTIFIDEM